MIHILGMFLFVSGVGGSYLAKRTIEKKRLKIADDKFEEKKNEKIDIQPEKTLVSLPDPKLDNDTDHYLKTTSIGAGFYLLGHFLYAPIGWLALPFLGYSTLTIFENAYQSLKEKKPRISILDSIAIFSGIAFGYYALSIIAELIYFGSIKTLNQTKNNYQNQFTHTYNDSIPEVWLLKNGVEISVPLDTLEKGDLIVINAGETVLIDGVITQGMATIDQHMLTGEANPEEKTVNQAVFATTLIISGRIIVQVEKTGANTVAASIADVLEKTDDFISELETRGEHFANGSVIPTIGISGVALLFSGPMAMVVTLSSNFSEVMRLSVPLSMLNYLNIASHAGLLIKDGRSLEQLSKVDTVIFDKTGTLTLEQPHVGIIYPAENFQQEEVLYYTAAAEYHQTHPIAKAILQMASEQEIELPIIDNAKYRMGYGICVNVDEHIVRVGSARFMSKENIIIPDTFKQIEDNAYRKGYSLIYTALDNILCGVIELCPTIRPEAKQVIHTLHQRGLDIYILSGDYKAPVKDLALKLGVKHYFAETLPEDKARIIDELQKKGKTVCFIGDGINDSIALKKAAVSISPQDASNIALDNAQIILTNKNLAALLDAFELAAQFNANQNLGIKFGTVVPSLMCMGGAIFAKFTIASTLIFYCASTAIGSGMAIYPLLKQKLLNKKTLK